MTRRTQLAILALFLVLATVIYFFTQSPESTQGIPKQALPSGLTPSSIEIDGRPVIGLTPGREKDQVAKMKINNIPSPAWKEEVEKSLKHQGGEALKDVSISTLDSFIWNNSGVALNVESVLITLTNKRDEQTKFRALVDSETGKILHSWDQPVFDPINPREKQGVKIDPRYFE